MIDQMPLQIGVEDMYFITVLSQRGEVVHLIGRTRGSLSVEDYVNIYCPRHLEKIGSQIPIKHMESLTLGILLLTIVRINGSASLHHDS